MKRYNRDQTIREGHMADNSVFISYSTQDAEIGRKFYNALTAQGHTLWMDWKSIALTADWWNEIKDGIETSDNFVFLISPNSIASPICHLEVQYAKSLNKRMIPVLITQTDERAAYADLLTRELNELQRALLGKQDLIDLARDNWKTLSAIQWINLARDGFEAGFTQLVEAVDTDLEYVAEHTRLLLRAKDWSRRGKTPSLLLRGDDLTAAEAWLKTAESMKPPANDDHRGYIAASRKDEDERARRERRQRRITFGLVIATVLAVLVGIPSVLASVDAGQRAADAEVRERQANDQVAMFGATLTPIPPTLTAVAGEIADGEARIESLRLAAEAVNILNTDEGNSETAALLGIRALRTGYSPQADAALVQATDRLFIRDRFTGHGFDISSVAFSPDGRSALSGSWDDTLILWDMSTGEPLRTFTGHTDWVTSVAFSPDGRSALSGSNDDTLILWNVSTGEPLRTFTGHREGVTSVAFSPDGRSALSGSEDNTLILWDVSTGEPLRTFTGHANGVLSVAFSPDGQNALSGAWGENTLILWDVSTGERLRTFTGHTGWVTSVAFSPDGLSALSGSADRTLILWNVSTGEHLRTFTGHTARVSSVAFSPDGRSALSGTCATGDTISCEQGEMILWDVATGERLRTLTGHIGGVHSVAFSPDGHSALSGSGYFLSGDRRLILWNISTGERLRTFTGHTNWVNSVAFSPDGRSALSGSWDYMLILWDISTGERLRTFTEHTDRINSVAFSPDGRSALSGSNDDTLILWDIVTGERLRTFTGHTNWVNSVAFSPDGRSALSGSSDETLILWDIATGEPLRTFTGHTGSVNSVAFSPDGGSALSGSDDGALILWDVSTGEPLRTFTGHTGGVNSVAFSPDGRSALSGSTDDTLILWDVSTGEHLRTFTGHIWDVSSVAFSPDGSVALSGSCTPGDDGRCPQGELILWDVSTGERLRTFTGHTSGIYSVVFSPDGRSVLSGSSDRTLRLWDTDYHDFISYACTRVFRDFTDDERALYGITDNEPTCPQFAEFAAAGS